MIPTGVIEDNRSWSWISHMVNMNISHGDCEYLFLTCWSWLSLSHMVIMHDYLFFTWWLWPSLSHMVIITISFSHGNHHYLYHMVIITISISHGDHDYHYITGDHDYLYLTWWSWLSYWWQSCGCVDFREKTARKNVEFPGIITLTSCCKTVQKIHPCYTLFVPTCTGSPLLQHTHLFLFGTGPSYSNTLVCIVNPC